MLQIIDQRWQDHLAEMDYLREGINLRAMGNQDPLVAWQREGFAMFGKLMDSINDDYLRYVFHVQVLTDQPPEPDLAQASYVAADDPVQGDAPLAAAFAGATPARARGGAEPGSAGARRVGRARPTEWPTTARPRSRSSSRHGRSWAATSPAGAGAARSSSSATAPTEMPAADGPRRGERRAGARRSPGGARSDWASGWTRPSGSSGSTASTNGGPSSRRRPPSRGCGTMPTTPVR